MLIRSATQSKTQVMSDDYAKCFVSELDANSQLRRFNVLWKWPFSPLFKILVWLLNSCFLRVHNCTNLPINDFLTVFPQFELRFIYFSSYRKSSRGIKLVRWSGLKRICECNQNCGVRLRWRWWIESCSTEDNDRGDVKVLTIKVLKRNSFLLWLFKSCISGLKLCLII